MKPTGKRKEFKAATSAQAPALRQLDADLIRFVEALAIADAKRDHLATTALLRDGAARNPGSQTAASTDDPCCNLQIALCRAMRRAGACKSSRLSKTRPALVALSLAATA
jgi:hypothetical protein